MIYKLQERNCKCGDNCGIQFKTLPESKFMVARICVDRQEKRQPRTGAERRIRSMKAYGGDYIINFRNKPTEIIGMA